MEIKKLASLLLVGLVMAGLVIGVVVLLTPLEDLTEEEKEAYLAEQRQKLLQAERESSNEVASPAAPAAAPERKPSTLELPTEATVVETQIVHDQVREMVEGLVSKFPADPGSWHIAAQTYAELNQSEKAEEYWKKCLELKPQYFGPYLGLAEVLTDKGRFQDAVEVLNRVFSLGGSAPEVYTKLGEALENLGQIPEAKAIFAKGYELFPDDAGLLLRLGRTQAQSGDLELAESNIREAIQREGENQQNLLILNGVLARLNKREEMAVVREKLRGLTTNEKKPDQAQSSFQEGYEKALAESMSQIYESAASVCLQQKDLPNAEKLYMQSLTIAPNFLSSIKGLSVVYLDAKRWEDLILVLNKLIEKEPDQFIHQINLASALIQVGDVESAEKTLIELIKKEPTFDLGKIALCKLYLGANEANKAVDLIREVADSKPDASVFILQAAILEAAGDKIGAQTAKQNADRYKANNSSR
ncbi:MAG: tetratricopeptide repeat protein [Pirellula sp.]|jgi:tetratricopeptide (TPR) repeat protein|nr:tetratricopeptide repeat protein [Pirellula sp.]